MEEILKEDSKDSLPEISQKAQEEDKTLKEVENEIPQGEYEINSHYRLRKECYIKAKKANHNKERALIISNAFQNYYYMG